MERIARDGTALTDELLDEMAKEYEAGTWEGPLGEVVMGRPRLFDEELETVSFRCRNHASTLLKRRRSTAERPSPTFSARRWTASSRKHRPACAGAEAQHAIVASRGRACCDHRRSRHRCRLMRRQRISQCASSLFGQPDSPPPTPRVCAPPRGPRRPAPPIAPSSPRAARRRARARP